MPQKIIYTSIPTQIYRLKESESSTRFLNLPAFLESYLVEKNNFKLIKNTENADVFQYKGIILKATYFRKFNQIKAFGTENQILAAEKGLAKKLRQAEVSFEEIYEAQPFRQNEKMQKMLNEAIKIRHQQFLSNAKNV